MNFSPVYHKITLPKMPSQNPERIVLAEPVRVSVVIPHFYSSREDNLKGLLEDLRGQTIKEIEVLVVHRVSPQGRAINEGIRAAKGDIFVVIDDDSRIGHSRVIENLIRVIQDDPTVGMAGASVIAPKEANRFQKMAAKQFPRFQMPVVKKLTDSDLPCHGGVAFQKKAFLEVGMERDDILRGLDPDLRVRFRKAGYRVVLAPETWVYHPLPESLKKFCGTFFRNGYGSAYLQIVHLELSYDTSESLQVDQFVPKRSFFYRLFRFPVRLAKALFALQWIRLLGYVVYIGGYISGFLKFTLFSRPSLNRTR